jgi:hypothetical protein
LIEVGNTVEFDEAETVKPATVLVSRCFELLLKFLEDDGWEFVDVGVDCFGREGQNCMAE